MNLIQIFIIFIWGIPFALNFIYLGIISPLLSLPIIIEDAKTYKNLLKLFIELFIGELSAIWLSALPLYNWIILFDCDIGVLSQINKKIKETK